MPSSKHTYVIEINETGKKPNHTFRYRFGSTKDIVLEIFPSGTRTTMKMGVAKTAEEFATTSYARFSDVLYKAFLGYLLWQKRILIPKRISVSIDDEDMVSVYSGLRNEEIPFIPSMEYEEELDIPIKIRSDFIIEKILKYPRSTKDSRIASLIALILAKVKAKGTWVTDLNERFMYLWISMNGYYSHVFELERPGKNPRKTSEKDRIETCLKYHGFGNNIVIREKQEHLANLAAMEIRKIPLPLPKNPFVDSDFVARFDVLMEEIRASNSDSKESKRFGDLTLEGYLTFSLLYHYRCLYMHGDNPMPLFIHAHDSRYVCLRFLCPILERFLDENLYRRFEIEEEKKES